MSEATCCPQCGSDEVLHSPKRKEYRCEGCGHRFTLEKPFESLRIFLSYGHDSNEELVTQIKTDLEERGHEVWFDKSEIKFNDDWRRAITDGIVESHRVLSFLSKHSTRDPGVCLDEIGIAIGVKGGNIQTILVESETEVRPPASVSHVQWLDMHDWKERRAEGDPSWKEWYRAKLDEIVQVVESEESRRFAGEIQKLSEYLKPISSDSRISVLLRKGFVGRKWLFDAIETWRNAEDRASRLFWIVGDPGVGKSAFAAHLTHFGRDKVVAAQFVEWDKLDHRNAHHVVCSLAFQLATRLPDYRRLLLMFPEIADLDGKKADDLFDYLLANPLRSVIGGGRERYLLLIDALDEAGVGERNPLVEMLARNIERLPDWLGVVVTSRPESAVKTPLQQYNPHVLHTRTEANQNDIREYLRRALDTRLTDRPDADQITKQVLEKSEGAFLYVERFCEEVHQGHITLDHPDQFPQGLGGIYCEWFQRQFSDKDQYEKTVEPMLGAILAAREPLPVEILQELFGWRETELRKWLRTLGSLFPTVSESGCEVIKPCHRSLADWLTDESKAGGHFVSVKEGHRILADFCQALWPAHRTALSDVVYHLTKVERFADAAALLFNTEFQRAKVTQLGRRALSSDFLVAEADSRGFFGLAGVGCELLHFAQAESEGVRPLSGQYPNYPKAEQATSLGKYVTSFESLFAQACQTAQQRLLERTSTKYCAAFCRSALLMFADDLSIVAKVAEALGKQDSLEFSSKLAPLWRELGDALARAKAIPRARSGYPPSMCDTAWMRLDYVERALRAAEAALQLRPLHTLRELWEARRCQAMAGCDQDPQGAIPLALDEAYESLHARFTFLLKSALAQAASPGQRSGETTP